MSSRVELVKDSREPGPVDSANLVVMDGGTEHRGAEVGPDPKDEQNRCVAEFLQIASVVVYWLYGWMDPRSIYESYPPGSLDHNLLQTFVSGSGSAGRKIWTHPKVALPFYLLFHSTQG